MAYEPKPLTPLNQTQKPIRPTAAHQHVSHAYIQNSELPSTLYRGMKFDDKTFLHYSLNNGLTMPPQHKNDKGEIVISDGQEYGLYLSDTKDLVDIYAGKKDQSTMGGRQISDIILGQNHRLCMPQIGVIYEVDTEGLNIRKPHLTIFAGHQNGIGSEYISDTDIPCSNTKIESLYVSADFLHDEQHIEPSVDAKSEIRKLLEKREEHLEKADYDLSQIQNKASLRMMSFSKFSPEYAVMRKLYGDSELVFKSPDELPKETDSEIEDYLLCQAYNEHGLDFKKLNGLQMRLSSGKAVEEYKTTLETSKQSESKVRLDTTLLERLDPTLLEIGYEMEMQKQAENQSAEFDY